MSSPDVAPVGIGENLPALQVVLPLMMAAVVSLLPWRRVIWGVVLATTVAGFGITVALLRRVLAEGVVSYHLGGWAPPWGIEYRVDVVNAFLLLIVSGIAVAVTLYARLSVEREISAGRIRLFYAAFLLALTGLLGITITGDVFNVFVFLEISSLSTYALVAMGEDRRALTSAFRYLILGSIGATFIVIGIGMMYAKTGTLNMADLAVRLPEVAGSRTIVVAYAFLIIGIFLKLALFPLHRWLPDAYAFAPSAATAFIAATATKVAAYVLLRFAFTIFGPLFSLERMQIDLVLLPLALAAVVTMSLVALSQADVKKMLAYSSLAQIGYIALGISLASVAGLTAGIVHLFNHALMKGALFMAVGCVRLEAMRGLGRRMPWTMAAFVAAGLSLVGVPLTVGFISKWYLILGAIEKGWWPVAGLVVITSLIAVAYIWRVVEAAYFQAPPDEGEKEGGGGLREAPLGLLLPMWAMVLANLYFGVDASLTARVAGQAARTLLGTGP